MGAVAATAASSYALSKGRGKGHRLLALALGAMADNETFDTGLDHVDAATYTVIGAAAAANECTMKAETTTGTITFEEDGTVAAIYLMVVGSVRGHA